MKIGFTNLWDKKMATFLILSANDQKCIGCLSRGTYFLFIDWYIHNLEVKSMNSHTINVCDNLVSSGSCSGLGYVGVII